MSSSKIHSRDV